MISVSHKPTQNDTNSYLIEGDSVDLVVTECLKRIRTQSQSFYAKELLSDLTKSGKSMIDRHAGMGSFYNVRMI